MRQHFSVHGWKSNFWLYNLKRSMFLLKFSLTFMYGSLKFNLTLFLQLADRFQPVYASPCNCILRKSGQTFKNLFLNIDAFLSRRIRQLFRMFTVIGSHDSESSWSVSYFCSLPHISCYWLCWVIISCLMSVWSSKMFCEGTINIQSCIFHIRHIRLSLSRHKESCLFAFLCLLSWLFGDYRITQA